MKILLIYPYFLEKRIHADEVAAVPLGLYYVGAMLKSHGYDAELINWHNAGDHPEMIRETLKAKSPDIIGLSIVHANRWGGIDIARIAKELNPEVGIVFGGIGATFLWNHLLTHFNEIDYVVLGEGEQTFLELIQAVEAQRVKADDIRKIAGLAVRTPNGPALTSTRAPIKDLDALPCPSAYYSFQHLALTRGCPGKCTFCGSPRFWGRRARAHSVDYFVHQMETLVQGGHRHLFISDDTFTLRPGLVIDVCKRIIERGMTVSWQAISRVNHVNREMLYWMRKAGCVQISYGVESGSETIRKRFCKQIDDDRIKTAFAMTVRHGILARAYFIYGAPGETFKTIDETLSLIRVIKPLSAIFYILDIFPGTDLYEAFKRRTGQTDDIWLARIEDILYFETDPKLKREDILLFGKQLRETYRRWLPRFALEIDLSPDACLKKEQADFLSRLGMTFSHGDYAGLTKNPTAWEVAEHLYKRALTLSPDARSFWGLAMLYQQNQQHEQADQMALQGLSHFPDHPHLNIFKAADLARRGHARQALEHVLPFASLPEAAACIAHCYQQMGDTARAARYARRLKKTSAVETIKEQTSIAGE